MIKIFNKNNLKSILLSLIPIALIINNIYALYGQTTSRFFANDEIQHSHIAWNLSQGLLLYKDFFEHHGPLYALINGLIFSNLSTSFENLLLLRLISLIFTILIAIVIFLIAQEINQSKLVAIYSVAIFFSWDIIQKAAIEIRPDLIQNFFWLLGFYLFIKFYKTDQAWLMYLCGAALGIAIGFNFKALAYDLILIGFALIDSIYSRNKKTMKGLLFLGLGFFTVIMIICSYFYTQNTLTELIYYTTIFNLGCINNNGAIETARGLHLYAFLTLDSILSFWFLLGLNFISLKSRPMTLMLLCITLGLYGAFNGLYPHNCLSFLPFVSIIVAISLNHILLKTLIHNKTIYTNWVIVLLVLCICFGTAMENWLTYPKTKETKFIETQNNINWILTRVPRSETITTLWSDCGGNVFNADSRFYWTSISSYISKQAGFDINGPYLINEMKKQNTLVIAAYPQEIFKLPLATRDYIFNNYHLIKINNGNNCIWIKNQ